MADPVRILAWPAFKAKLSPYNALLYGQMQELGATVDEFTAGRVLSTRYDIVHLHWPEYCVNGRGPLASLFWSCALFAAMCWIRILGGKVVWTVHNLKSHIQQYPRAEQHFWRVFTGLLNGYVCLTETGRAQALQCHPALRKLPGFVIPHGNIRDAYPEGDISREQARSRLGITSTAKVLAFFGSIQAYKGVSELVDNFSVVQDERAVLLVAGKCTLSREERTRIEDIAARDPRLLLHLEYVPQAQVTTFIRASDLIVLPFREILNSGSAVLALSLDRPVLMPDRESMRELEALAGAEWVRLYSGELTSSTLQRELDAAIEDKLARGRCNAFEAGWEGLSWRDLARLTLDAYSSIRDCGQHQRHALNKPEDASIVRK